MPIYTCEETRPDGISPCTAKKVTFTGAVLARFEKNFSDDSDFYALVWNLSLIHI